MHKIYTIFVVNFKNQACSFLVPYPHLCVSCICLNDNKMQNCNVIYHSSHSAGFHASMYSVLFNFLYFRFSWRPHWGLGSYAIVRHGPWLIAYLCVYVGICMYICVPYEFHLNSPFGRPFCVFDCARIWMCVLSSWPLCC